MLKKLIVIFSLALNMLATPMVFAQIDLSQDIAQKSGYPTADSYTLSQTVGKIIKYALGLVGTIFLILTVYAGFLWMTAAGEESKVEKAQEIIKTSVIGLAVVLAAYSITYFVMYYLAQATL